MASNAIELDFNWQTSEEQRAKVRANAVFIYAKLVAGGMDVALAAEAVQDLFEAGRTTGYDDGYDAGRDQVAPLGDESYRRD
jgi:hypothetical protein